MIKDIFSNTFETSSSHDNKNLLTHNYQNNYDDSVEMIIKALKKLGYEVSDNNTYYKELLAVGKHGDIIVTCTCPSYYLTKIDFKINCNYLFPFKRPVRIIKDLYEILDHSLILKSIGDVNA